MVDLGYERERAGEVGQSRANKVPGTWDGKKKKNTKAYRVRTTELHVPLGTNVLLIDAYFLPGTLLVPIEGCYLRGI